MSTGAPSRPTAKTRPADPSWRATTTVGTSDPSSGRSAMVTGGAGVPHRPETGRGGKQRSGAPSGEDGTRQSPSVRGSPRAHDAGEEKRRSPPSGSAARARGESQPAYGSQASLVHSGTGVSLAS